MLRSFVDYKVYQYEPSDKTVLECYFFVFVTYFWLFKSISKNYQQIQEHTNNWKQPLHRCILLHSGMEKTNIRPSSSGTGRQCNHRCNNRSTSCLDHPSTLHAHTDCSSRRNRRRPRKRCWKDLTVPVLATITVLCNRKAASRIIVFLCWNRCMIFDKATLLDVVLSIRA